MSFKNQSVVQVSFMRGKETLALGQLALKDRIIFFEYHPDFIKTGLELSPFKLPLKAGMTACRDQVLMAYLGFLMIACQMDGDALITVFPTWIMRILCKSRFG